MNDHQRADHLVQTWLESEAPTAPPTGLLDRIDIATRSVRPRPTWIARLEGHHVEVIEGRPSGASGLSPVFIVIALVLATVAGVAFVASQRPSIVLPDPSATPVAETSPDASLDPTDEPSDEPTPARIVPVGALTDGRSQATATILQDGRVLVTGGYGGEPAGRLLTSTEVWDPLVGAAAPTGSVAANSESHWELTRAFQTAVLMGDGRVLLVPGGCWCSPVPTTPAEIWDPETGSWSDVAGLTLTRHGQSVTLLADGRILLAGGSLDLELGSTQSARIWDLASGTSTATGPMTTDRAEHSATLLADGRVLIVGGNRFLPGPGGRAPRFGAEIWDPATNAFTAVPSLADIRGTAITLPDGRVFILDTSAAHIWDPRTDTLIAAGSLETARQGHTTTLLSDGRVLVVGGYVGDRETDTAQPVLDVELWDPASLAFSPAGTLTRGREYHTTVALADGRALILGGLGFLDLVELWEPAGG